MPHLCLQRLFIVAAVVFVAFSAAAAQTGSAFFEDRQSFETASARLSTIDFETVAPRKGFGKYAADVGLNVHGVRFRSSGGARFGPGWIFTLSTDYASPNPGYNMGTGANLTWAPPNQPGNASLDISLPAGTRAVGADIWAGQPHVSPIQVEAVTRDGETHRATVTTKKRPDSTFIGFAADSDIVSIRFTPAKGQVRLLLDNFAYGRVAEGVDLASLSAAPAAQSETPSSSPNVSTERPVRRPDTLSEEAVVPKPVKARPEANISTVSAAQSGGNITYVRDGKEIRMISPDGRNDRRFWSHPDAHESIGINEMAWKPDGTQLVVSSGHEAVASFYHADLYTLKPDGTGARRLTNGPDRSDYPKYPKGTVTVTVRNEQPIYRQANASSGIFIIYVVGADLPQPVTLPPGASRTLVFKDVVDYGDHAQAVVAVQAQNRWFIPGTDVKAGRNVKAPDFGISGDGIPLHGAFRPVWNRDGTRISYRNGLCIVSSIAAKPPIGHSFNPLFKGENAPTACAWDFGPTAATADQIIYGTSGDDGVTFYKMTEGGRQPGEKLLNFPKDDHHFLQDVRWLPDGSGFLYSVAELMNGAGNIYRYDLTTRKTAKVTSLDDTFTRSFTVSPDGKWIVFERTNAFTSPDSVDLWIIGTDGRGARLLVKNGYAPAWTR